MPVVLDLMGISDANIPDTLERLRAFGIDVAPDIMTPFRDIDHRREADPRQLPHDAVSIHAEALEEVSGGNVCRFASLRQGFPDDLPLDVAGFHSVALFRIWEIMSENSAEGGGDIETGAHALPDELSIFCGYFRGLHAFFVCHGESLREMMEFAQ